jgi:hypothetical protein
MMLDLSIKVLALKKTNTPPRKFPLGGVVFLDLAFMIPLAGACNSLSAGTYVIRFASAHLSKRGITCTVFSFSALRSIPSRFRH